MTRTIAVAGATFLMLAAGAHRLGAHHSFAAVFDANKAIDLTGTVTKLEWTNPHVWIYLDVKSEAGPLENWGVEMGSPSGLVRRGWSRNTLKVGDTITVAGYRARDESLRGAVLTVTLSTGERLFGAQQIGK